MSASANVVLESNEQAKVTNISASARIDYIMRFSKQAVLVLDPIQENYTTLGNDFLANLPDDHNAAYICVSTKLNDIQIRCRLIEQLFSDVLFDPEQPLAASVLKFAKDTHQVISIVVENAHSLSLQLMHELCQLAELADKSKRTINVLLLGQLAAGKLAVQHKVVFHHKLTMISANSGQLITFDSPLLKDKISLFTLTYGKKMVMAFLLMTIISIAILVGLYHRDSLTFSGLPGDDKQALLVADTQLIKPVVHTPIELVATPKELDSTIAIPIEIAAPNDILKALTVTAEDDVPKSLKALSVDNRITVKTGLDEQKQLAPLSVSNRVNLLDQRYFLNREQGFAVQIIGFSQQAAFEQFLREYPDAGFAYYERLLSGQRFIVVTSKVYPIKTEASAAMTQLPTALQQRGPWIKSVTAINREIKAFQRSQ